MAELPDDVAGRSALQHRQDTNEIILRLNTAVYCSSAADLNAAIVKAATLKRPLIIVPNTYTLNASSALLMSNLNDVHIFAYGATFVANMDMASLLDVKDCTRCSWHGGWFRVLEGRKVDNAVYVYCDTRQATRNTFQDMTIEGDYTVGLRVGKQGSGLQCDHMWFTNMEFIGRDKPGQIAVYVGDGIWGNCLNHTFTNLLSNNQDTHILVDATNAYVNGAFFNYSLTTDLQIAGSTNFAIRNVRSEGGKRFMVTGGPADFLAQITIEDVDYHAELIADDGQWIQYKHAGLLKLGNVRCVSAAYPPVVNVGAAGATLVRIDGLSTVATAQNAFALGNGASVKGDYIQHDSNIAVTNITTL